MSSARGSGAKRRTPLPASASARASTARIGPLSPRRPRHRPTGRNRDAAPACGSAGWMRCSQMIEQPIEAAQRVRGEDRARRRRRCQRLGVTKRFGDRIRDRDAAAARHPARHRRFMIAAGGDDHGLVAPQRADIAPFLQIAAGIVDPERPPPRLRREADEMIAAIGDIEIAAIGHAARQAAPRRRRYASEARHSDCALRRDGRARPAPRPR